MVAMSAPLARDVEQREGQNEDKGEDRERKVE